MAKAAHSDRNVLGMTSYYRRSVQNYAKIAAPLTDTTKGSPKKNDSIQWNEQRELAFEELKDRMTRAPVLKPFDSNLPSIIETDASDFAVGATLSQTRDGQPLQPVAYFSRKL